MWFANFFKGSKRNIWAMEQLPGEMTTKERKRRRVKTKRSRKANRVMRDRLK